MDYRCGNNFLQQEFISDAYVPGAALCKTNNYKKNITSTLSIPIDYSPKARLSRHKAPRLANQLQVCCGNTVRDNALYSTIHQYDLVVHTPEFIDQPDTTQYFGAKGLLRQANPDLVQLTYHSPLDIPINLINIPATGSGRYYFKYTRDWVFSLKEKWKLKGTNGNPIKVFEISPGVYTEGVNQATGAKFFIPQFLYDRILKYDIVDGVYWDWCGTNISWLSNQSFNSGNPIDMNQDGIAESNSVVDAQWRAGLLQLYKNMEALLPAGSIQMGNFGYGGFSDTYMPYIHGGMMEQFLQGPTATPGYYTWDQQMRCYSYSCINGLQPTTSFLQYTDDTPDDFSVYPKVRFALASALMFDGYFSYTNLSGAYAENRWIDEFAVNIRDGRSTTNLNHKGWLGAALTNAYAVTDSSKDLYTLLWS